MINTISDRIKKLTKKTRDLISSNNFVYFTIGLFILQGVFFSGAIAAFIPADEKYHYEVIQYYSQENIANGPFIQNQKESSLSLGDLERNPGLLYHYSMSFPLRAIGVVTKDQNIQILSLRIINTILGALCLLVFVRIGRLVTRDRLAVNLSTFLLSITGMFVWISSAVTYDVMANLFFFLFIYSLAEVISRKNYAFYVYGLIAALATSLSKPTFIPILVIGTLLTVILSIHQDSYKKIISGIVNFFKKTKYTLLIPVTAVLVLLTIWTIALPISNLIIYKSPSPSCDKIHSFKECSKNAVFKRDNAQKIVQNQQAQSGAIETYHPFDFAGDWFETMYTRVYYYFGHKKMEMGQNTKILFSIVVVASALVIFFRTRIIPRNRALVVITALTAVYVAVLYFYNLNTRLSLGASFGFQGRYLLPVIGFIYLGLVLSALNNELSKRFKILNIALAALFILAVVRLNPITVFINNTDNTWYSDIYQENFKKGLISK